MNERSKNYILKSGEILQRAKDFRSLYLQEKEKLLNIALSLGAEKVSINDRSMKLDGLVFPKGKVPKGYLKPNRYGATSPRKNNKELQEYFQQNGAVILFKPMQEFISWLGCPTEYGYKYENTSGRRCIGHFFYPIGLYWFHKHSPILLQIPDVEFYQKEAIDRNLSVDDDVLSWRMRHEGVREVLQEEWDFMVAKYKHKKESERG